MEIKNYILKLTGKSELPQDINIGHNYHISLEGGITAFTETDNQDGTHNRIYTFKPIKIDLLNEKGETLQLKDTRSKSQLLRGRLYGQWTKYPDDLSFDDWYERLMNNMIQHAEEIVEMYMK